MAYIVMTYVVMAYIPCPQVNTLATVTNNAAQLDDEVRK